MRFGKGQRRVIFIGTVFVILAGLIVPYEHEKREYDFRSKRTIVTMRDAGYGCVFSEHYDYQVDTTQLWIHGITIVVATIGGVFLFARKKDD